MRRDLPYCRSAAHEGNPRQARHYFIRDGLIVPICRVCKRRGIVLPDMNKLSGYSNGMISYKDLTVFIPIILIHDRLDEYFIQEVMES